MFMIYGKTPQLSPAHLFIPVATFQILGLVFYHNACFFTLLTQKINKSVIMQL
jgi:hypothetical protein